MLGYHLLAYQVGFVAKYPKLQFKFDNVDTRVIER